MTDFAGVARADDLVPADHGELVARYRRFRDASYDLHNRLVKRIPHDGFEVVGTKLGVLKGKTLLLDFEDQISVLADCCLYDLKNDGRTIVERLPDEMLPDESDEAVVIRAMQQAFYSLFVVESVRRGLGVVVRDLRTRQTRLVVDMGISATSRQGSVFAARLLPFDGFAMTTGAPLPIGVIDHAEQELLAKQFLTAVSGEEADFDAAPHPLSPSARRGRSMKIRYANHRDPALTRDQAPAAVAQAGPPGRNSLCPCGSGKKYKQCCMRRG